MGIVRVGNDRVGFDSGGTWFGLDLIGWDLIRVGIVRVGNDWVGFDRI